MRRAEALLALVAYHVGGQHGVAGVRWAEKAYSDKDVDRIDFASAAAPDGITMYLQQAWGAYGAAYQSQLFSIGIFWESPDHAIPVPSTDIGERLADAFSKSLGDLAPVFQDIVTRGNVSKKELALLAPIVPSMISPTGTERAIYEEVLLKPRTREDAGAISRRLSIQLILTVTALLGREPTAEEVRWILYSGQDQQGHPLSLRTNSLENQRQRWWVYHANDVCHIALETLLKFALDTLAPFRSGLSFEHLVQRCTERICKGDKLSSMSWYKFADSLDIADNPYSAAVESAEWSLCQSIEKGAGRSDQSICSAEVARKAVMLLAILQKRIEKEEYPIEPELGQFDNDYFQTLLTVVRFLQRYADEPTPTLLGRLIELKVIRRHLWVATRKLQRGDYTFLFESDEGRLRLREKDGPVFTNPRLSPAISFLQDIHLIDGQGLTPYGEAAMVDI